MALIDFSEFAKKVMDAAKAGLTPKERGVLSRLFSRTKKRNTILAAGLLSALKAGGAPKADISALSELLGRANERILQDRKPFTKKDEKEIGRIFMNAHLPKKASARLRHNVGTDHDELLACQLASSIKSEEKRFGFVPERKAESPGRANRPRRRLTS